MSSSALPVAPSAVSAANRSISSVLSVRTGPSWPWNTPVTRASASVVVSADWLVSKVTVILLIVGHRPVFQTGPGEELLCPPQTAPRHLSGFTQHDDGMYFGNSVRLVHLCHCISGEPGGTFPGHGTLPRAETRPPGAEHEGPGIDRTAGGRAVTVTGYAPDDLTPARPDRSRTPVPARRTAFDDLADQAARLPWCWPALVTLAFGFYQVGRPELWRDELASWSFARRPVTEMISAARHTGATQLAYYLLLHVWIAAFGDSYAASLALLGYVDVVALSVLAGHAAGAVLRSWHHGDRRQMWFIPVAAAGLAACLPVVLAGSAQAGRQVAWILRPGLDLTDFAFFGRNLFYSTSVATALIILAVLAWAVAWREAAFMTAVAIGPVAAVWLVSQGTYSYFFPRYLLFTVGAWAVLAGIGLSKLDGRIGAAALLIVAILGAGDQQVIRETGAHNWTYYPGGSGGYYMDYASAAAFVAPRARAGDGIVYQGREHQDSWLMVGYGLQYYLARDMPNGMPVPRELFIARTATQAGTLYPEPCQQPAACWVPNGGSGSSASAARRAPTRP